MIFGIRIITDDIDRLVEFYEHVTGTSAARPTPFFAELRLGSALLAIASPATVAMLGEQAPRPADNHSVVIEFLVTDADSKFERIREHLDDVVLEPTTMPWGNRAAVFHDPDGNTVNLFSPPRRLNKGPDRRRYPLGHGVTSRYEPPPIGARCHGTGIPHR